MQTLVKPIRVEKKDLKISAKQHMENLKENPVSRKMLEEEDEEIKKTLKKIKEEKEGHAA